MRHRAPLTCQTTRTKTLDFSYTGSATWLVSPLTEMLPQQKLMWAFAERRTVAQGPEQQDNLLGTVRESSRLVRRSIRPNSCS